MATSSKSRRGKTGSKKSARTTGKKSPAAKAAETNGGERLSPAEKRLEGVSLGDRRKAVKMAKTGESINDIAEFLDLSPVKAKFLVMQQQVEDGDVPAIKSTDEKAILRALKSDDDYSSVDWVSCRARIAGGKVKQIADEAGHEFTRGAPRQQSSAKKGSAKKASASKRGSASKRKAAAEPVSKARRGKGRRRGGRPNA